MIIAPQDLSEEALMGLLEAHIMQEGTDYGEHEISLGQKRAQLLDQVLKKKVLIVFDHISQSTNLVTKESYFEMISNHKDSDNV